MRERLQAHIDLIRPRASLTLVGVVFLPLITATHDLANSISYSLPIAFIATSTYIINAIDDMEADTVNHPGRPLVVGLVSPATATIAYFISIFAALLSVRQLVPDQVHQYYFMLAIVTISYGYAAEHLPLIKPFYVGLASAAPIGIVQLLLPGYPELTRLALATFFFVSGKELCMDFIDQPGDPRSILHELSTSRYGVLSFGTQALALPIIIPVIESPADFLALSTILAFEAKAIRHWYFRGDQIKAIHNLHWASAACLYFLLMPKT